MSIHNIVACNRKIESHSLKMKQKLKQLLFIRFVFKLFVAFGILVLDLSVVFVVGWWEVILHDLVVDSDCVLFWFWWIVDERWHRVV